MRRTIVLAFGLATAVVAFPVGAAAGPIVFASATDGSLRVTSSVFVAGKSVSLMGGWEDLGIPCTETRKLRVVGDIFFTPRSGPSREVHVSKQRFRMNCAEGGPNLGFTIRAANRNLACPNGRWKPGDYQFATRTVHKSSGLKADASLGWTKRGAC